MRFLALGDSYTIGEGVEPSERWPIQLAQLLREEGINIGEPTIIAATGWTTAQLLAELEDANPDEVYDLVSLQIGVNNQYQGWSQAEYRQEFVMLLQRAITFAARDPSRVLVLSIPDWSITPFAKGRDHAGIRAEIDSFNAINRQEANRAGVHHIDVTSISREAANDPSLVTADSLHPSGQMYAAWTRLALPAACEALSRK